MELFIYEKNGNGKVVKRSASEVACQNCGKIFLGSKRRKLKFCSKKCSDEARKDRIEVKCENCGKIVEKKKSQLKHPNHKKYFCSRKCKEFSQSLRGNCREIRPDHYGEGSPKNVRKHYIKNEKDPKCIDCGENKEYFLVVHHKDSNRRNNEDSNLEIVCVKCHIKRHLKFKDNKWSYSSKHLTPRDMLDKL